MIALSQDDRIIDRVQQGDRSAYLELFDRYYPRVESYARWQLRNPEAARDAASETFLRAFRSIGGYRVGSGTAYLAYLLQICRRLIYAERAREPAMPPFSIEQLASENAEPSTDEAPLFFLLEEERRVMIQRALSYLSTDDREIIHLAFERDLSRRDIAVIMGKPSVTAVTSHLYRALQKLRAVVVQQGYFAVPQKVERS